MGHDLGVHLGGEPVTGRAQLLAERRGVLDRAVVDHRDDAGVLRPGAVADLVVLDRDPFAAPVSEIGATRVVSTWIDGQIAHEQRNR